MADINAIIEEVKKLTVLELNELVKALEAEFGVSAAAAVAVSGGAGVAAVEEVEEQTEFDVVLNSVGPQKIQVIKAVREIVSGLGLVEAKALVDGAPNTIKEGVDKETAETIAERLRAAGAEVLIK